MNDKPVTTLERKKDRRGLLALIGAGGAAALAALLSRSNGAQAGHGPADATNALHLGQPNTAPAGLPTLIDANSEHDALRVTNNFPGPEAVALAASTVSGFAVLANSQSGRGVDGASVSGIGVRGESQSGPGGFFGSQSGTGVEGRSESGAGGNFHSESESGVLGASSGGIGVQGLSQGADGVHGESETGIGALGFSQSGIGVFGVSPGDGQPAVQALSAGPGFPFGEPADVSDGGLALDVIGKARFSTAGSDTIPQRQNSVFVANPAVTANSHITVTLATDPGPRQLRWVQRNPGIGFTAHLTSAPPPFRPETAFTYLIVDPGA